MLGIIDFLLNPAANLIGKGVKNAFKWMIKFFMTAVIGAVRRIVEALIEFMAKSSSVSFSSGWWTNTATS